MTPYLRVCLTSFRRLRRSKHAFVTSIGVVLLVYVILASDVISFKPRSVVDMTMGRSNRPQNQGERFLYRGRLSVVKGTGRHDTGLSSNEISPDDDDDTGNDTPSGKWNTFHFPLDSSHNNNNNNNNNKAVNTNNSVVHWSGSVSNNSSSSSSNSSSGNRSSNSSSNSSNGLHYFDSRKFTTSKPVSENSNNNDNNIDNSKGDYSKNGESDVAKTRLGGSGELFKGSNSGGQEAEVSEAGDKNWDKQGPRSSILLAGVPRSKKVFLSVGMVTVKRDKGDYFFNTMTSLLQHSSPDEQRQLTIVVMLADREQSRNQQVLESIKSRYRTLLESGLLLVIRGPDTDFIFRDNDVKRTYDDSLTRVQWRSKQNLDYAAVIEFCANLSNYYLHLEDDVVSAEGYVRHIRDFIREKSKAKTVWAILEVCPHGFIGKLFKTVDLPKLVTILRTFYLEQPCDFLISYFMRMMTQPKPIVRPSPLFFHQGRYSSLSNVTRKLDKLPGVAGKVTTKKSDSKAVLPEVVKKVRKGANPEAEVRSDFSIWQRHGVENAYNAQSEEFTWASGVREGQRYTVVFARDQRLRKLFIETGFSKLKQKDRLQKGRVEMGTRAPSPSHPLVCPEAKTVGHFSGGHFDVVLVPAHHIRCFSVVVAGNQTDWLIVREIVVVVVNEQ